MPAPECPDPGELDLFAAGGLEEQRRHAVQRHLTGCRECRERLAEYRENLGVVAGVRDALAALGSGDPGGATDAGPRPERIGPFRIVEELGRGGMGIVYRAEQDRPRRQVALKVLAPGAGSPERRRRFEHEADLLGRLEHPGIARVLEAGVDGGRPWLAMELVRGERLDVWVERARPTVRERLALLARVADAVHHAHLHGVVHRDLKPGNVLVVADGTDAEPRPKVLDFGVARATDADLRSLSARTEVGQLLGTVPFMSPEQVLGDPAKVDARSDVYSLGVLGHWLLTGALPYPISDTSIPEAARIIRDEEPATLSSVDPAFRGDVEIIFAKALEKDRDRRYPSAAELAADLRRHLADEPIVARAPSTIYQLAKFARRHRPLVAAAAVVAVVLAAAAATGSWLAVRATRAEREARAQLARAEAEAAKQEAVKEFLERTLASANPYREGEAGTTVVEALDAAAAALEGGALADAPAVEAAVRSSLGNAYWAIARYEDAEAQLAAGLARAEAQDDVEARARALADLGMLSAETNRFDEAEARFREQHALARERLGPAHAQTAGALGNLAGVLADRGELAAAESVLGLALEASAGFEGEERAMHASNLRTLAGLRYFRGDLDGAEVGFRDALAVKREIHGDGHPETVDELEALGVVRRAKGDRDGAVAAFREVLAANERAFGGEHPKVASSLDNLAMAIAMDGEGGDAAVLEEAEALLRRAVEMNRTLRGAGHRETARSLNDLGQVLRRRGRPDEAAPFYREALGAMEAALGPRHPSVATVAANLGNTEAARGRTEEARALLARAVSIRREKLGAEHAATREAEEALAALGGAGED